VERDVRQLINVENLHTFQNFIKLCAGHVGQSLDVAGLATNCGINRKTAAQWLSLLEASYILFFLRPHFNNFNKIITKTPKLYFFDTGLACSLLGIRSAGDLALSHFRGHLFESYIIADLYKQYCNAGLQVPLYFWRDHNGRIEIDCLIDMGIKQIPIEIKSSETIAGDFFKGIKKWSELAQESPENGYVVYGGEQEQHRSIGTVIGWKVAGNLIAKIEKL
jgi:predicted AAA+ superfamily ATPase